MHYRTSYNSAYRHVTREKCDVKVVRNKIKMAAPIILQMPLSKFNIGNGHVYVQYEVCISSLKNIIDVFNCIFHELPPFCINCEEYMTFIYF